MRVILNEDVRGLGKKREVKEVNDGYARNFLMPRRLAKPATASELGALEEEKARFAREDAELLKRLVLLKGRIEDKTLVFDLKAGGGGAAFGSVNKEMILKSLRENGLVAAERVRLKLDRPIKEPGEHEIEADLGKGVLAKLKVMIRIQA